MKHLIKQLLKHRRAMLALVSFLPFHTLGAPGTTMSPAIELGAPFTNNAVLQRESKIPVWGWCEPGADITVTFAGQNKTTKAGEDGAWRVELDPLPAGADGRELRVQAGSAKGKTETVVLQNLVLGDVFFFARQTSIDLSLGRDEAGLKAASMQKKNPLFRVMRIETLPAVRPQRNLASGATDGWQVVDRDVAVAMSAAAYYFGRDLASEVNVPVGLIDLDMGSAFPMSWLSREALLETEQIYGKSDLPGLLKRFDELITLREKDEPMPRKEIVTSDHEAYALFPSGGYHAVLHPLKGLPLKGLLVQLGNDYPHMIYTELERSGKQFDREELNRAYVQTYDIRKVGFRNEPVTIPRIPREWREVFEREDLPVALIAPPGSGLHTLAMHHREMRELQRRTAEENPGTVLVLPGSSNIAFSAQPLDDKLLADRSLAWARGAVYRKPGVPASGPLFARLETRFNEATVYFKEGTARGLRDTDRGLMQFEAAGVDLEYTPVKARIDGEVVRLKSDTVPRIVHVRFNWSEVPDEGLVNAAGLPAIPFRTEDAEYAWMLLNEESDLPLEYSTPANEWKDGDVTLVNGQLKTHGYQNFTGWLGPIGVRTGPFGPNMGVREVKSGSPADGKLFEGDVIFSANGNMLGEEAWTVMAAAMTESETTEAGGKLELGVRRDGKNIAVDITMNVMGSYSPTAPYDCPKTEKIITDLENWLVARGGGAGFLNTDALFLLATGNPKHQGLVRRVVYDTIANIDPSKPIEPTKAGKSWHNAANALLLGEYFHATGDRHVLPHLKNLCDRLAATQHPEGGWRHNFPGGPTYGLIPNAGLPGVMGMYFAKEAGLDINMDAYQLGLRHFGRNRAETGYLIYGVGGCEREVPAPIDPEKMAAGELNTYNGGLSSAGILMRLAGHHRAAHLCSLISAYAWNNTFDGHGGNFWNNFWTPLGAHDHGRPAFIHFWKEHRWYRECNRMYDGSLIQHESGKVGAGPGIALVAPRQRLRILGAPRSPFAVHPPAYLKPALEAYAEKDYARCESLVNDLLTGATLGKDELPTVEYLGRAAREIQESIAADLAAMAEFLEEGRPDLAEADLIQLAGILPERDPRLTAIQKAIGQANPLRAKAPNTVAKNAPNEVETPRVWECLVSEIATSRSKADKSGLGKKPPEEASSWRMSVVEDLSRAPENWMHPGYDDSAWGQTHLPISWRMYHTALLRTTFHVQDPKAFDGLRFQGWLFRQQGIEIYLNGQLIGKVNNLLKKTGNVEAEFNASAVRHLRKGDNTLAVTTRHNWRWGMLFMHVYNDGFGFRLDGRQRL